MSTATLTPRHSGCAERVRLAGPRRRRVRAAAEGARSLRRLHGYFLGAGLISGGLVHYPLDPARYAKVALAGVAVFLAATVLNDVVLAGQRAIPPHTPNSTRLSSASARHSVRTGQPRHTALRGSERRQ